MGCGGYHRILADQFRVLGSRFRVVAKKFEPSELTSIPGTFLGSPLEEKHPARKLVYGLCISSKYIMYILTRTSETPSLT